MGEQLRAKADVDPVRRVREKIGAQTTEQRFETAQGQHAEG